MIVIGIAILLAHVGAGACFAVEAILKEANS